MSRTLEPLPLFAESLIASPSRCRDGRGFLSALRAFSLTGACTVELERDGLHYFVNEYWTAAQRQAHRLHEISYRACFKPQLPAFFIERLTSPDETIYDPFSGRGTTAVQAALMGRGPVACDVNPLSAMLVRPRLDPPSLAEVSRRLQSVDLTDAKPGHHEADLLAFYHPETLAALLSFQRYLLDRQARGEFDRVDDWLRMVAISRLTGHSPGFFSVYTMPPNQAVSPEAQRKINRDRDQVPPPRDVIAILFNKTKKLLADGVPPPHPPARLMTGSAIHTPTLPNGTIDLVVTSPPFLDVVDYAGDNWLRCWFAGIDPRSVHIDRHSDVRAWEMFVRQAFAELGRIVRPGGIVAFEVGEVRGGRIKLERHVAAAVQGLPFTVLGVMVNQQAFTKTSNCWGVTNNAGGTNTNRIVLAERSC